MEYGSADPLGAVVMSAAEQASIAIGVGVETAGAVVSSIEMDWVTEVTLAHWSVTVNVRVITIGQVPVGALSW